MNIFIILLVFHFTIICLGYFNIELYGLTVQQLNKENKGFISFSIVSYISDLI